MVGLSLLGVANRTEAVSLALRKHLLKSWSPTLATTKILKLGVCYYEKMQ